MDKRLQKLLEKRAKLVAHSRSILDAADAEERALSAEERNNYDAEYAEIESLTATIQAYERQASMEATLAERSHEPILPEPNGGAEQPPEGEEARGYASPEYRAGFDAYLRGGVSQLNGVEMRALQANNDELGGYLRTPLQMVSGILKAVDNAVFIRQWANVMQVETADGLGVPTVAADPSDPTWTSELDIGGEDSTMTFGKRELHPHPLAKYIKISRKLLRTAPSAEDLVSGRLAYKFAIASEKAYLTGSGANQPLGVFTASADGISTGRDVSSDNTTTAMTMDGLKNAKYTLKGQYHARAKWVFHRDGVKMIAKLKDSNNQYLWQPSVRLGEPDRLLNMPVFMSEYAPNTFTTGQYVGILGDFSQYWIADAMTLEIQRLVELFAATNQVGLIGRLESDGMPVLEEAFVRVTLA